MRWSRLLPVLVGLFVSLCPGQVGPVLNPGFEDVAEGQTMPAEWSVLPHSAQGFTIQALREGAAEGQACVTIRYEAPQPARRQHYAAFEQGIEAVALQGKRIRLTGSTRAEGAEAWGGAGLWVRINAADGSVLFLDNMRERLVRDAEWTRHAVEADVPAGAAAVTVGGLLLGGGQAWFDGFALEVVGASPEPAPAAQLSDRGEENLAALARLVGVVRYFHPSVESDALDWDDFTSRAARHVEPAADASELAARLEEAFAPVAPSVRVTPQGELDAEESEGSGELRAWKYHGYSTSGPDASPTYYRELVALPASDALGAERVWRADLTGGVSSVVPLYAPAGGTGSAGASVLSSGPIAASVDDRWTRLAAVISLWNVLEHFHPYVRQAECEWEAALRAALQAAASEPSADSFLATLRGMTVCLADGQLFVANESDDLSAGIPLAWRVVEGELLVTGAGDSLSGLKPGDRVLSIEGVGSAEAVSAMLQRVSASPQRASEQALLLLQRGARDSVADLQVQTLDGVPRRVIMRRRAGPPVLETRPQPIAEIEPGIWYVDLSRTRTPMFVERLSDLAGATGIVFDARGPSALGDAETFFGHLVDRPLAGPEGRVPVITRPGLEGVTYESAERLEVEPLEPALGASMVFLADARTMGPAEAYLDMVRHYALGLIVGGPSAGAYGRAAEVVLPGGYRASFTAMYAERLDGSPLHGAGVEPDVDAAPTREGVEAGRDEVLEAALEILRAG